VFQVFQRHVVSASYGCCKVNSDVAHVAYITSVSDECCKRLCKNVSSVLNVCCKCFDLDVLYVSYVCCETMF
jgi:hypothetical protein